MTDWMVAIDAHRAVLGLGFVVALFMAFALERFPPVTIAVAGAATMIALGWLTSPRSPIRHRSSSRRSVSCRPRCWA